MILRAICMPSTNAPKLKGNDPNLSNNFMKQFIFIQSQKSWVVEHLKITDISHIFFNILLVYSHFLFILRLVHDMSKLAQPILMVVISSSIITICVALLIIRIAIVEYLRVVSFIHIIPIVFFLCFIEFKTVDSSDLLLLVVPAFELIVSFSLVFVCCELAGRMSRRFDEISSHINQFKWYLFPNKIKQNLPFVMMNAQKPVYFEYFGTIPCDRQTFQSVSQLCDSDNIYMFYKCDIAKKSALFIRKLYVSKISGG